MAWREGEVVDKTQALLVQAVPYHVSSVFSAELAEILCGNDFSTARTSLNGLRLEPSARNPFLYFLWLNVQGNSQV